VNAFSDQDMDLDPSEAARRHEAGELIIVDVREPYEWEAGHVPGSSHVEMERVASMSREIPKNTPVALLCLGGVRSGLVAHGFRAIGYDAYNVRGGFAAWLALGLPSEPDGAVAAPH
jgi:hydroxyacylglutathione hydrolase/adenylyltransferase/sulfurtransferase